MTTFRELRGKVLQEFDITREELESPSRNRTLVIARTALVNLCRQQTDLSFQQIATGLNRGPHALMMCRRRGKEMIRDLECYRALMS